MATINKAEREKWINGLYIYEGASNVLGAKINLVTSEYNRIYLTQGYNPIQKESSRIKTAESAFTKVEKEGKIPTVENIHESIHDIVGYRVVLLTINDIALFAKLLASSIYNTEGFKLLKIKDLITTPKPNGYRSLHFRVLVPVTFSNEKWYVICEIQMRTSIMDAWAQIEHKSGYKPVGMTEEMLATQLAAFSSMGDGIDKMVSTVINPNPDVAKYKETIDFIKTLLPPQEEVIEQSKTKGQKILLP